jgi:hypothetical protein
MQTTPKLFRRGTPVFAAFLFTLTALSCPRLFADQVEMQNGDRYNGKVISITNDIMVVQSEVLGTIIFPRAKVARISLGSAPAVSHTSAAAPAKSASTNSAADALAALRQPGAASDAAKVKQQLLADADPAAKAKFDAMLGDLMSGKMTVADLRVQAKSAADQLRALKKELGPESDSTLDSYLSVLESFLKEVPTDEPFPTKAPATTPKPSAEKDE